VATTLPLPARLTFVLIFLLFQLYSLMLQVYKVSQEDIPEQIKSRWQSWFIHWCFLGFLKRGKRGRQNHPENAVAPQGSQTNVGNSPSQPNGNRVETQTSSSNTPLPADKQRAGTEWQQQTP